MSAPETEKHAPLEAELTSELPATLAVGAGTCVLVEGTCTPSAERGSLRLELGSAGAAVEAERMPAPGDLGPGDRWWALLGVPAGVGEGELELRLVGRVAGAERRCPLATVEVLERDPGLAPLPPSVVVPSGEPLIAICMATHEPDPDQLERQLDSIRAQDWPAWVCLISDDASSLERFSALRELVAEDGRFVLSRSEQRLGFYRNFERALAMTPVEAGFVALCDQDDRWDADKLAALHAELARRPDATLAYSDMRITDERGRVISDTYWILRGNRWDDIASLLVANTVTGAASLFRRGLLADALPFPPPIGVPYHDHWLALCALATGELIYLDRPTYDRVRHLDSVTAHTRHAKELLRMRDGRAAEPPSRRSLRRRLAGRPGWRAVYFQRYLQLVQFARILEQRAGDRIERGKLRGLRRLARADGSVLGPPWLALRSLRPLIGRDETMARERVLLGGVLWRRLVGLRSRLGSP